MSRSRPSLAVAVAVLGVIASIGACGRKPVRTVGGVAIQDLKVGTGATATAGKVVSAHYVGTFPDGKQFDSSYDAGAPIDFLLGAGKVGGPPGETKGTG